ncbi:hypothetical protein HDE_13990 [Halotydeus destructor]|nr:hypothetical protein HDE_13990 [Halotydeus destructor]
MDNTVRCLKCTVVLLLASQVIGERFEEVLRASAQLEDKKESTTASPTEAIASPDGQDVIGYIVVPYPGEYGNMQQRSSFPSFFSYFNPVNYARSFSRRSKVPHHQADPMAAFNSLSALASIPYPSYMPVNPYTNMNNIGYGMNGLNSFNVGFNPYNNMNAHQQLRQSLLQMLGHQLRR